MSNDTKPTQPKDNLTRIAVKHIWFPTDCYLDVPGVASQLSNVMCGKVDHNGKPTESISRWFTCDFVPSWQMFEMAYHVVGGDDVSFLLTPGSVKKWVRA